MTKSWWDKIKEKLPGRIEIVIGEQDEEDEDES